MSFDHPYTCPDIDRSINSIKDDLQSELIDFLSCFVDEAAIDKDYLNDKVDSHANYIYESIFESAFENTRQLNSDIRHSAEKQIDDLEDRIDGLEDQIGDLQKEIRELESQLEEI